MSMHARAILNGRHVVMCAILVMASCLPAYVCGSEPRDSEPGEPQAGNSKSVDVRSGGAGSEEKEKRTCAEIAAARGPYLQSVNEWVDEILVKGDRTIPLKRFVTPEKLDARWAGHWDIHEVWFEDIYRDPPRFERTCTVFSPPELAFVVSGGREAIHSLIELVSRVEPTPWTYMDPMSSFIAMDERPWLRGEVACYLVEAINREQLFLVELHNGSFSLLGKENPEEELCKAAPVYQEWYERCFDPKTCEYVCGKDDFPQVGWTTLKELPALFRGERPGPFRGGKK